MVLVDFLLTRGPHFFGILGYLFVFFIVFIEAVPFIGVLIPGSVILFVVGFLAKLNYFNYFIVTLVVIFGAIIGDFGGYVFGRYFGKGFLEKFGKYFLIKKEYLEKSCEIVHNHTGKSLIIGRFNPLTRCAAPFVLGSHKVPFDKFMFFNIVGGILWGFTFVSLGFVFGQSYVFAREVEKWIVVATIAVIIGLYGFYFLRTIFGKVKNRFC